MFSSTLAPSREGWLKKREKRSEDDDPSKSSKNRPGWGRKEEKDREGKSLFRLPEIDFVNCVGEELVSVPRRHRNSRFWGDSYGHRPYSSKSVPPFKGKPKQASASKRSSTRHQSSQEAAPTRSPSGSSRAARNSSDIGNQRSPSVSSLAAHDDYGQHPPVQVDAHHTPPAVQRDLADDPPDEHAHDQEPDARSVSPV